VGLVYVDVSPGNAIPIRNQMSRFHSYLNSASSILDAYKGEQPFNIFLKSFFGQHKKFGSKDRKEISHLCYCYFRLGQSLQQLPIEERILSGLFLCDEEPYGLLAVMKPDWNEIIALPAEEKCALLDIRPEHIFPWAEDLSEEIEIEPFANSFLVQPDLYIRIRPNENQKVRQKLQTAGVSFNEITHTCFSFNNATQLDKILHLDKEAVVQDYNSQRVGELLDSARSFFVAPSTPLRIYDCCAASGGKSILAYDILGEVDLTVSDIRESILINLKKRFQEAGIKKYKAFVRDLSSKKTHAVQNENEKFDLIICDAPCSGSGTWGRTPEQLYYFNRDRINHYSQLQQNILSNVIPYLKKDGLLLYITCSVFKKENEQQVQFLQNEFQFELKKMEVLKGYEKKADTLFAVLLQKVRTF
jgi:16S rRNA (cytosine967-C5)-methyltransferase